MKTVAEGCELPKNLANRLDTDTACERSRDNLEHRTGHDCK